ncbi:MAG: hypothetical protein JKY28_03855, partial [Sulfurimonas sp.]|nr:hypothetical protein [Sulfurimonas sp.]
MKFIFKILINLILLSTFLLANADEPPQDCDLSNYIYNHGGIYNGLIHSSYGYCTTAAYPQESFYIRSGDCGGLAINYFDYIFVRATTQCDNGRSIYNIYRTMYKLCPSGTISNEEKTECLSLPTCTTPNTTFPALANNENTLFTWTEDNNRSNECTQTYSARVQERTQECKPEYRCVKEIEEEQDPDKCRNQPIASYVSPTAGVFHEDITL